MGNVANCCHYNNEEEKDKKIQKQNLDFSFEQNLFYNQNKVVDNNKPINDENLNESSIIGIMDFNSTSYINVNLQILSRLKFFTDYLDIKLRIKKNNTSLKNLKTIFDNLLKGFPCNSDIKNFISEIGHLNNNNESKIKIGNDALNFHIFMLDYINNCISVNTLISKDNFKNENTAISQIEIFNLRESFRMSFENEIKEMFYLGIISSNNSSCDTCQFIFQHFQITSLHFIDLSPYNELDAFQKNIDKIVFERQNQETNCEKCNSKNNIIHTQQIINYPKYLLIKIELMDGLDIDLMNEITILKKKYILNNIIFAQDKDENINEYCVSTKLNGVWYHCDNNNVVSIKKDNLLNNSYILYYSRVEATL